MFNARIFLGVSVFQLSLLAAMGVLERGLMPIASFILFLP